MLLKPARHRVNMIVSKRHTESTKVLRYWEVLQWEGAREYLWATKVPRVIRKCRHIRQRESPLKGYIGLLLILNMMHNTATDHRWARFHSQTPPAKKTALLTTHSKTGSWAPHCWAILQDQQDKSPKIYQKGCPVMKYLPGLSHDTKPLSCSSGNRAKHDPQYNEVGRLLQYSFIQSQWGWLGMNFAWPGEYHSLSLTSIQFHSSQVTPRHST